MMLLVTSTTYAGGFFSVGHRNFDFTLGSSSGYGNTYTVAGASVSYFITDDISVGAGYSGWFGGNPKIHEINFPVTYYLPTQSSYRPYGGIIYRHTFIDDPYSDYDVFGVRAGVAIVTGSSMFMRIGWVQERYDDGINSESRGYPEISAGFLF